jgi:hypothetical protein
MGIRGALVTRRCTGAPDTFHTGMTLRPPHPWHSSLMSNPTYSPQHDSMGEPSLLCRLVLPASATGRYHPDMSEPRKPPSVRHYFLFAGIAAVLLPVAYFLSLGPVAALLIPMESRMPGWAGEMLRFYVLPADVVYQNAGPRIQAVMDGYISFFTGM